MGDRPPVRKLYRSRTNRMLAGVCGGLAEYSNVDPTIVRILAVVATVLSGGLAVLGYIAAMVLVPEDPGGDG